MVETLVNVFTMNAFQVHHGGRQVFVAEPFLEFGDTTNIPFQVDDGEGVPKLVKEPVAAIRPFGTAVSVLRKTGSAVKAGPLGNVLELAFEVLVRSTLFGREHQVVGIRSLLSVLVNF